VGAPKLSIEFVRSKFLEANCELMEGVYVNCMTKMSYRCNCGEVSSVRWNDFKKGVRCNACCGKKKAKTREANGTHWSKTRVYSPPQNRVKKTCETCGDEFEVLKHRGRLSRFCCRKCMAIWKESNTVFPVLTPQQKRKQVDARLANGNYAKENNPNWKGGITPVNAQIRSCDKYKEWVQAVYRRDVWKCRTCGAAGRKAKLEAHHKKSFATIRDEHGVTSLEQALLCEELWDVDNGETLCIECHGAVHPSYNLKRVRK
jgi:hypothetical protein